MEKATKMATGELHVVLGASGGTGSAVVEELATRGRPVRAVNRKGDLHAPAGVERMAADVSTPDGARRAAEGASVVYHCAQPEYTRWVEEFPVMNRAVMEAAAAAGAKLVVADNLYMYDSSSGPISESTTETATTVKGQLRRRLADDLLAAHRAGTLRVTIGRSSDYYGPNGTGTTLGDRLFEAILAGKKAQWMGSLDQPHTCSYLPDMARALAILGERDEADGRAWVLPAAEPVTGRAFIEAAARAAGTSPRPATISTGMMRTLGLFMPFLRAYTEMMGQWTAPFTIDASAFQQAFGPLGVTPHDQALATTVAWFSERKRTAQDA
jgi:nucleoside-diphosphate-sugar epimerase